MSILPAGPENIKSCLGICGTVTQFSEVSYPFEKNSFGDLIKCTQISLLNVTPTPDWADEVFAVGSFGPRVRMSHIYPWASGRDIDELNESWDKPGYPEGKTSLCGVLVDYANGETSTCPWCVDRVDFRSDSHLLTENDFIDTITLCGRPILFRELNLIIGPTTVEEIRGEHYLLWALQVGLTNEAISAKEKDRIWGVIECQLQKTSDWNRLTRRKDMTRMKTHCLSCK